MWIATSRPYGYQILKDNAFGKPKHFSTLTVYLGCDAGCFLLDSSGTMNNCIIILSSSELRCFGVCRRVLMVSLRFLMK